MGEPNRTSHQAEFQQRLSAGDRHRAASEMEHARAEYLQALAYAETHLGAESSEVDRACLALACLHSALEEPAEELAALERRVRIRRAKGDIPDIVDALQDVAQCLSDQTRSEESLAAYAEAVALCDESNEAHRPMLRSTLLYFGNQLLRLERPAEALPHYERGLRLCRTEKPFPAFGAARLLLHRGEALLALRREGEAIPLLEQAMPLLAHRSQRPSTSVGKLLYYLANFYQRQGRYAEAERTYAVAALQTAACDRPNLHNLAYIFQAWGANDLKQQRSDRAERHLRRALKAALRAHAPHESDVLSIQQDLVNILIPARRYAEAETVLTEMVAASQDPGYDDEFGRERLHNNLGFVQVHLEEFPKAELNLRRALAVPTKDGSCYVIKNLGLMYQKMGYVAEAIREYERALPLFVRHHGADHPVTAFIREALAELRAS
jgi:tetratricopeptide (TPR) repeat protein